MPNAQLLQYDIHQGYRVPDGVLIEQALKGDQWAFENLVHRYRRPLLIIIRGILKDSDQAYDVLQHVFFKLYLSLPVLLTDLSLKPWLFQVARNRCVDELRKRHRQAEIPFSSLEWKYKEEELSPLESVPDPEPLPEEVAESIELHCLLQQAIFTLPPKLRSIVHLHCFGQLSFLEIGRRLKMPEPTVKTYFYRSLPRLRTAIASSMHFEANS
jgi:RNA polymerase sigma factor (sigma-70 family)